MPDGKRNSLPSQGETDGENSFYHEDLQNIGKKPPLNLNTRGLQGLSEKLLRAMVANEVKKTLDATDNKKLVAHHLPVLHPENDNTDSESMVVVSVLLNAKQSQNDEVSKAIEMLRRNGVNCVYFTLNKDASNSNGTKNGESQFISEEILKAVHDNENGPESPEPTELNTEKKVSSPTISTTSDYAAPSDSTDQLDVHERPGAQELGDVGTSLPSSTTTEDQVLANLEKDGDDKFVDIANVQDPTDLESCTMPTLSPSPPVLFPQVSVPCDDQTASMLEPEVPILTDIQKPVADNAANRRKKRRKRMYPYVSRRKHRNKRKKVELPELEDVRASEISDVLTSETLETISSPMIAPASPKKVVKAKAVPSSEQPTTPSNGDSVVKNLDPYEFEDSDIDTQAPDFFDTLKLISRKPTSQKPAKSTPIIRPASSKKAKKRGTKKRSPRKRLIFSDNRAFSPDITDRGNSTLPDVQEKTESTLGEECNFAESCVQSISTINDTNTNLAGVSNDISLAPDITENDAKLVLPSNGQCQPLMHCDDDDDAVVHADQASTSDTTKVTAIRGKEGARGKKRIIVAQESSEKVQRIETQTKESTEKAGSTEIKEPLPIASNDSLPDTPDSMQLRRSSFYSSISRNVRTNLEKYLDGRPQDLKAPKRPKKIKNGFLLHHGDNFPDNPEAPYRLHLATQVLLKLNKRRAKCKPKEDKGKSLLSYLKLQPKRISRGGKHSKPPENLTTSNADEEPTTSVFSGDWTVDRKYICNICGQVENVFWDMVMHKGEVHPGIVVTHVELSDSPPDGFRKPPTPRVTTTLPNPPPCSKCSATFSDYSDLHRHIFECAGNAAMLEDTTVKPARKKKGKRKRGFKRRISSLPKKKNSTINQKSTTNSFTAIKSGEITKRRNSEVFKCGFCERFFKTEGWLKNHVSLAHSLPISIPLFKLSLPSRASISSRRFTSQMMKPNKQVCRET